MRRHLLFVVLLVLGMLVSPAAFAADKKGDMPLKARVIQGVQIYACRPSATQPDSFSYVFVEPRAVLASREGRIQHGAGPFWEAEDGSRVVGTVVSRTDAGPGNIPELELAAQSTGGPGVLADVETILRVNTKGGVAPEGPCDPETEPVAEVRYKATYLFFSAEDADEG